MATNKYYVCTLYIFCGHGFVFCGHNVVFGGHELVFRAHFKAILRPQFNIFFDHVMSGAPYISHHQCLYMEAHTLEIG